MLRVVPAAVLLAGALSCTPTTEPAVPEQASTATSASPGEERRKQGVITFGVLGDVLTLDPYDERASDLTWALARPLYPSLYRLLPDGSAESYLASSIEHVAGGVRVFLREASWSDGTPITARDVAATIRRATPGSGFSLIRRVVVEGEREVSLFGKDLEWEKVLAARAVVLPDGRFDKKVQGGPFTLGDRIRGLKLEYVPFDETWWGGEPAGHTVEVFHVETLDIMLALLERERLDAAALPSALNLGERLSARDLGFEGRLGWESLLMTGPVGAVLSGVDRDGLHEGFVRDDGKVARTVYPGPKGGGGGSPPPPQSPSAPPFGARFTLEAPTGDEQLQLLQEAIQIEMFDRGVEVDLTLREYARFYGEPAEVDMVRIERRTGTPVDALLDPIGSAYPLFRVKSFIAWSPAGDRGFEVNPSADGPLWNAHLWEGP